VGDIVQKVKVDEQAVQPLRAISRATEELAEATRKAGQQTEVLTDAERKKTDATKEAGNQAQVAGEKNEGLAGALAAVQSGAMGFVSTLAGAAGLNALMAEYQQRIAAVNQSLIENAKLTRDAAQARLDLVALKGVEKKEDVLFIDQAAAIAGRGAGEVARTMAVVKSRLPNASDEQIKELVGAIAYKGQQTEAPLVQLAEPFINLFQKTKSARTASNVLEETIKQAGEVDPGKIGPLMAKVMGTARSVGKMSTGEAAGFTAAATGLGLVNEVAVTGVEKLILGIRGKAGVEGPGAEIMDREGIDRGSVSGALRQVTSAYREGRITDAELESIGGVEGLRVLGKLTDKQTETDFFSKVDAVVASESRTTDDVFDKSQTLFGKGSIQGGNLQVKQLESEVGSVRAGDERALRADIGRKTVELILRKAQAQGSISPGDVDLKLEAYGKALGQGDDPVTAAERVEFDKSTFDGIKSIFTGQSRFGPELGRGVFESLQLGPNLDPNIVREFNIEPATGKGSRAYEADGATPEQLSTGGQAITINYINSNVNTSNPIADPSPAQEKQ